MFCITIALKDNPAVWTLMFQKEDDAQKGFKQLGDDASRISIADDFGQLALVEKSSIAGAMFEDLDKSMLAHVERGLHNARTQAHAEKMAMNDPVLKNAAIAKSRGPAIYDPQGNGLGHR